MWSTRHHHFFIIFIISISLPCVRQSVKTNKYQESFDPDDIWKKLYRPEFQPKITIQVKNAYISPADIENGITERKFDEIIEFIGTLAGAGECYPDLQEQIQILGHNEANQDSKALEDGFGLVKGGESGTIYSFRDGAIKITSVQNIGVSNKLSEFESEERDLKYFIREINTNKIVLASYLEENNTVSNLGYSLDACVEKIVIDSQNGANTVQYKFFMWMPMFENSLRDVLGTKREEFKDLLMDIRWKRQLLDGIMLGIYWIHHNGCAHRDIKPANILLDKDGIAYVSDFGFAKEFSQSTKSVVGSQLYMAPELRNEDTVYGHNVDVYSTGVLLFELLNANSRVDIKSYSRSKIITYCLGHEFPVFSVEKMEREVYCKHFKELISKMLATNPEERISMIQVIQEWLIIRDSAYEEVDSYEMSVIKLLQSLDEDQVESNFILDLQTPKKSINHFEALNNITGATTKDYYSHLHLVDKSSNSSQNSQISNHLNTSVNLLENSPVKVNGNLSGQIEYDELVQSMQDLNFKEKSHLIPKFFIPTETIDKNEIKSGDQIISLSNQQETGQVSDALTINRVDHFTIQPTNNGQIVESTHLQSNDSSQNPSLMTGMQFQMNQLFENTNIKDIMHPSFQVTTLTSNNWLENLTKNDPSYSRKIVEFSKAINKYHLDIHNAGQELTVKLNNMLLI